METNEEINNLYHKFNCIKCGKELIYYSVNDPIKDCPCIDCQLKEMGKK